MIEIIEIIIKVEKKGIIEDLDFSSYPILLLI